VREAANERAVLRRIAPHLAQTLRMVMPTYRLSTQVKLKAGLFMFEKLAPSTADERHDMLSKQEALATEPLLAPPGLHGRARSPEYLTDDARLVLANVIDLCRAGGLAVNHCRAVAVEKGRVDVEDDDDRRTLHDPRARRRQRRRPVGRRAPQARRRAGRPPPAAHEGHPPGRARREAADPSLRHHDGARQALDLRRAARRHDVHRHDRHVLSRRRRSCPR
jgi:hypothetical protein